MNEAAARRKQDRVALGALVALHGVLFARILVGGKTLYTADFSHYQLPLASLVGESLRAGRLPLWNPYLWLGTPLCANPAAGVFYPPTWLAALDPIWALNFCVVLHLLGGGVFTYFLARERALPGACAFAAGVAFSMGGIALSYTGNPFFLFSLAWLPAVLWAFGRRRGVLGALATAMMLLAGDVQAIFGATLVLCALGAARVAEAPRGQRWRVTGYSAALGALILGGGLLLASIEIWPALEATHRAERAFVFPFLRDRWSLHPTRLGTLALPYLFGAPLPENSFWGGWIDGENRFWFHSIYAGALVLAGACAAVQVRKPWTVALAAAALLLAVLAMGHYTPVYALATRAVPMLNRFRYPEKMLAPLAVVLPVLGAEGLASKAPSRRLLAALAIAAALGAAAWGLAGRGEPLARAHAPTPQVARAAGQKLGHDGRHLLMFGLCGAALCFAARRRRLSPTTCAQALGVLAAADVALAGTALVWLAPRALLDTPAQARGLLVPDGPAPPRILHAPETERVPLPEDLAADLRVTALQRDRLLPAFNVREHVGSFVGYGSMHPFEDDWLFLRLSWQKWQALAARLATGYVFEPSGVRRLEHALPRARLAGARVQSGTLTGAREAILAAAPEVAIVDADEALFEGVPLSLEQARTLAAKLPTAAAGEAVLFAWRPEEIRVRTHAAAPALLVLCEAWFPGWRASVDGNEAPIFRADALARAVPVGAGAHDVRVWFEAPAVGLGARASGCTLGALLLFAALARRRRRRLSRQTLTEESART